LNTKSKTRPSKSLRPIVALGDLVADFIVAGSALPLKAGQHQEVQDIYLEPGGAANFLIAGARLDYPMQALGALGEDTWGEQVANALQTEGIDLSRVRHNGTTTRVVVLVSRAGEHVFLGKYGHGEVVQLVSADIEMIGQAGALYCAGYTLNESSLSEAALQAMHTARQAGVPVFFDPGPQIIHTRTELREQVLPLIDTLLITEEELPLFTSHSLTELLNLGPDLVVVKRGAAGCLVYGKGQDQPLVQAAGYPVSAVDTSAAGDSFNAAFIVARLWGWPLTTCVKLANAVGAAKVKKLGGGRNVPTLTEIQQVLAQFEPGIQL
jgi:ribokinase